MKLLTFDEDDVMKTKLWLMVVLGVSVCAESLFAGTLAYWRYETGPAGTNVTHSAGAGQYSPDIPDVSGNGNDLSVWETGGGAGFVYRDNVAFSTVPLTGATNDFCVKNTGGGPAMWCNTTGLADITLAQFTIEVTFKLENGGHRTIMGRDSFGTNTAGPSPNSELAAMYLQGLPGNALAIKFCDVDGYWHEANSASGTIQTFDFPSDPDGNNVPWYSAAAVSDGQTLSLYLLEHGSGLGYQLIAQTDLTASGSSNTAMTAGAGDGGDWDAGDWTVARGLYNGGHVDRAYGFIDEVRISDVALSPTNFLQGPLPTDPSVGLTADTINGDVDAVLNWNAAGDPNGLINGNAVHPDIVDQYVFMTGGNQQDPNLYYLGATGEDPGTSDPASSFTTDLAFDTGYQWVVVAAIEGNEQSFTVGTSTLDDVEPNNLVGPIWSFTSLFSIPVIVNGPDDVLVNPGDTAEIAIQVTSLSPATYSWFKSLDAANDTPGDDTSVGSNSAILSIANAQLSDEAYYYCIVGNEGQTTVSSDVALLEVSRLVAWYAFENDITDSQGNNDGAPIKPDPNAPFTYISGQVGQAISLNGSDEAVEIARSIRNSMTIEFWVQTTSTAGVGSGWFDGDGLIDGELPGFNQNDFGVVLRGSNFTFGVGDLSGAFGNIDSTTAINDGDWHYCVATRDHTTGEIAIYVDGSQEAATTAPLGRKDGPDVLRIGSIQTGINYFAGQLDEVKLYNYPKSELEVAADYNAVTGESVCITSAAPSTVYDLNGDCIVDLADIVDMFANWLDCGLFPDCINP